jgi:hypothetical protein
MKALKKYLLTAGIFFVAFGLPSRSLAAPNQTLHFKFMGLTADAVFDSFDASGCIDTFVFVTGTNGRILMPGGPQVTSSAAVSISQFDFCTSTDLLEAFGFISLPAGAFQIDKKLTSATLNTTVAVTDFISSATFNVDLSISWTGSGGLTVSKNHNLLRQAGLMINETFSGSFRQGTASGSVTGNGTNFSPLATVFADLTDVKQGQLVVVH